MSKLEDLTAIVVPDCKAAQSEAWEHTDWRGQQRQARGRTTVVLVDDGTFMDDAYRNGRPSTRGDQ